LGASGYNVRMMDAPEDLLREIDVALQAGDVETGMKRLRALEAEVGRDGKMLQHLAQFYTQLNLHADAERCHRRALETAPGNPEYLYNLATSAIALGKMDEAESLLDRVIAIRPDDYDAYYNRATLRKQTVERNHVVEIERRLSGRLRQPMGEVQLGYALAKELEDLGEYRRSFAALKRGADARRRLLSYRVEDDMRAMDAIASTFDAGFFAKYLAGERGPHPIFILGLPRSGTTLVDRILSSHSKVESLGEINDFARALMRAVPNVKNKFELISGAADADFAAIGRNYAETTHAVSTGAARAIDKTPVNFLYLGLIARALPDATIIHVRRNAMDVCYAMYKTLFRMAYPFSYDLTDLANYYIAYDRLMDHWTKVLPGRIIDLNYEDVVADQNAATRRLVAACRLGWEDACLAPERNERPSLTASAAQVRQKVYANSVGLWRAYEKDLRPLAEALRAGGVDIQ
jgi:tetratricopeptide (TPR) repeat protein